MDENEQSDNNNKVSVNKFFLIGFVLLFFIVCGVGTFLYFNEDAKCAESLAEQQVKFNESYAGVVDYVAKDVTNSIITAIIDSTNDCKIVTINSVDNTSRQLADILCIEKAYIDFINQQINKTQG